MPHLAPTVSIDGDNNDDGDQDDAAGMTNLQVGGTASQIRLGALHQPVDERPLPADRSPRTAGLVLGDARHAQDLDRIVDRAGRDAWM